METYINEDSVKKLKNSYLNRLKDILEYNCNTKFYKDKEIYKVIMSSINNNEELENMYKEYQRVQLTQYKDYSKYIDEIFYDGMKDVVSPGYPIWFSKSGGTTGKPKVFPVFDFFKGKGYWDMLFPNQNSIKMLNSTKMCNLSEAPKGIFLIWKKPKGTSPHNDVAIGIGSSTVDLDINDIEPKEIKYIPNHIDHLRMSILFTLIQGDLEYFKTIFINTIVDFFYTFENDIELIKRCLCERRFLTKEELNEPIDLETLATISENFINRIKQNTDRCSLIISILNNCTSHSDYKGIAVRIWPNLQLIVGIYSSITLKNELNLCKFYTSNSVFYANWGYASSESLIGLPVYFHPTGYTLFDKFFPEFIPYDMQKDEYIKGPIPVWELETGKMYEIVITTYTGYCRYKQGDIIKVIGWYSSEPVVEFIKRIGWSLVVGGYRIDDEYVMKAIESTELPVKTAVAYNNTYSHPASFGFFVELISDYYDKKNHNFIKLDQNDIHKAEDKLNRFFSSINELYEGAVKQSKVGKAIVNIVPKGEFDRFKIDKAKANNTPSLLQIKIPLCITDEESIEFFNRSLRLVRVFQK